MASLFGGPLRTQIPSYWSHAGTFRVGQHAHLGTEPLTDLEGVRALGEEVRERGFKALKTNLFVLGGEDGPSHIYVRPLPLSPALSGKRMAPPRHATRRWCPLASIRRAGATICAPG